MAGNGSNGFLDGVIATAALLNYPTDVAVDAAGNLFIADAGNHRIRKVDALTGIISTIAGTGVPGFSGDGASGLLAALNSPYAVALDGGGNIYVADSVNRRVRKLNAATGNISTIAGTGAAGYSGENIPATSAGMQVLDLDVDALGNVYLSDVNRVRKIDAATGLLTTVVGNGEGRFANSDGGAATAGQVTLSGLAVNSRGSVLVVADGSSERVRKASYLPTPPVALTLTRSAIGRVQLNWSPAPGSTSYVVKRGTQPGGETPIATNVTGASYEDAGAIGSRHYYVVSAMFDSIESVNSNEISVLFTRASTRSDTDGDGQSDVMLYRPNTGSWFFRNSAAGWAVGGGSWSFHWGSGDDRPLQADFDGDGKVDPAVFRPNTGQWFILYSSRSYDPLQFGYLEWGAPNDVPLTADFDRDGNADAIVYRPSTGQWFLRYSSNSYAAETFGYFQWGRLGDMPRPGDFDGDGTSDVAVYRPSTGQWFIRLSSRGYDAAQFKYLAWGGSGDAPLAADFDGDGATDVAAYRPATGEWFILRSSAAFDTEASWYFQWGASGDVPVVADFDGDGRTDISIYRPTTGQWFMRLSGSGYSTTQFGYMEWGTTGDTPMPLN